MLKQIKQYKSILSNSKEGKTVFANFGYLSLLQLAGYIFPLITLPYLARVIGTDGFGKIAFAAAIISWIQTIADWGFNYTATRDVAQHQSNKKKVSEIFSNVLWARCLLTFISLIILLFVILIIPSFRENITIILVTFLIVPGHVFFPDWFFQALEKMKYTTIFNIIVKLLFTILCFVVIKEKEDYIYQPILTSIGYLICGIVSLWLILHKWGYSLVLPNLSKIISTIKASSDVFLNNIVPNLYNSFSVMLLGSWSGTVANGIFDGGNKFNTIVYQFHSVISRAFFPFLSRRQDKMLVFQRLNMISGIFFSILLFLFAPIIVNLMLAPEFSESTIVLRILAISMIFMVMSNTYGTNYLIIVHEERILRNITIVCSIFGMAISFPLVYFFSYVGAALTVFISRFVLGLTTYIYAKIIYKKNNYGK